MEFEGALKPVIKPTDFEFGGMTGIKKEELFSDGCIQYLPVQELQIGLYFDTYGCVSFSFNNALEILIKRKINLNLFSNDNIAFLIENDFIKNGVIDFDDQWLVVKSETIPKVGNSGWKVADTARKLGVPPQTLNEYNLRERDATKNNIELYYNEDSLNPLSDYLARDFSERFEILYEWVKREDWEEASKEGVLQVYTKAWYQRADGTYYNPVPGSSGHAIVNAKFSELKIFDTYNPFIKQMEKEEDFYPWALKINIIEKSMTKPIIENNTLVQLVSGRGGFGLYLDGNILVDDVDKILATFVMRNNGKTEGKTKPLLQEQWDMFAKYNLKMEQL